VDTVSANPADESVRLTGSMQYDDVLAALAGTEYAAHRHTRHGDAGTTGPAGTTGNSGPGADSGGTGTGQRLR